MTSNVIFNLADTTGADIVNAKGNLQLRSSKLRIYAYDLFDLMRDDNAAGLGVTGSNPRTTVPLAEIQRQCNAASKIILSSHGPLDSTNHSVIKDPLNLLAGDVGGPVPNVAGRSVQISLDRMAELVGRFLPGNRKFYVATLICYAARTGNYAADHGVAGVLAWRDSFACQLFARLCAGRTAKLTMSARTGQHGFSRTTGLSEVQTEAAVMAEVDAMVPRDYTDLDAWLHATRMRALAGGNAVRDPATVAFATRYYTDEAVLMGPQKLALLTRSLATGGAALPPADRQQFEALRDRMRRDTNRVQVAEHSGKIYYYYDPAEQSIKIKRDNRNRIGWHSKTLLEETTLAQALGQ